MPRNNNRGWNACDYCGRFISLKAFEKGWAIRRLVTPDSDRSSEEYENKCPDCRSGIKRAVKKP